MDTVKKLSALYRPFGINKRDANLHQDAQKHNELLCSFNQTEQNPVLSYNK